MHTILCRGYHNGILRAVNCNLFIKMCYRYLYLTYIIIYRYANNLIFLFLPCSVYIPTYLYVQCAVHVSYIIQYIIYTYTSNESVYIILLSHNAPV